MPQTDEEIGLKTNAAGKVAVGRSDADVGADPIDRDLGAPMSVRSGLTMQSNPEEAKAYLEKIYGKGNYGQDETGEWWVTEEVPHGFDEWKRQSKPVLDAAQNAAGPISGLLPEVQPPEGEGPREKRKVAVFPKGFGSKFQSELVGSAPAQAGAIAGSVGGGLVGGTPGMIGGAMLGGAAGKGAAELYKNYVQGSYRKTPDQLSGELGQEALTQGAFAAAGPVAKAAAQPLKKGMRWWAGVTPETEAMGRKFLNETWIDPATGEVKKGVIPPFGSVAPKSKALEFDRYVRNLLTGDPKDVERTQYMLSRIKRSLTDDMRIPPVEAEQAMTEIVDKSSAISGQRTGEMINDRLQRDILGPLRASADTNMNHARAQLNQMETNLRRTANLPVEQVPERMEQAIGHSRGEFGRQMNGVYDDIHVMTGGEPVVPFEDVSYVARNIVNELNAARVSVPPSISRIAGNNMIERLAGNNGRPPMRSIEQAHTLRTELRAEADKLLKENPLAPGPTWHRLHEMAGAVDDSLRAVADSGGVGSEAAGALREADNLYRQGMRVFNSDLTNDLVKMVRRKIPPDPELMVRTMFTPEQTTVAQEVWNMLPPNLRVDVQRVQLRNLVNDASTLSEDGMHRTLDGKMLLNQMTDPAQRRLLAITHSQPELEHMEGLARGLAAYDAQVNIDGVMPGGVRVALERAFSDYARIAEFAKSNPLKALVSGDPREVSAAADYITEPGRESGDRLQRTLDLLSHGSPEAEEIRKFALRKLLNSVIFEAPTREKRVSGKAIIEGLSAYTKEQQDLLFRENVTYLKELARDSRFLFPHDVADGPEMGRSLSAASIKSQLPRGKAIKQFVYKWTAGWVADHPQFLGMLADLQKADPTAAAEMRKWMYRWAADSQRQGPGPGRPAPEISMPEPEPDMPAATPVMAQ